MQSGNYGIVRSCAIAKSIFFDILFLNFVRRVVVSSIVKSISSCTRLILIINDLHVQVMW